MSFPMKRARSVLPPRRMKYSKPTSWIKKLDLKVNRLAKKVRPVQAKSFYYNFGTVSASTTGVVTAGFNQVPQGDTDAARDGDMLMPRRLLLRGAFAQNATPNVADSVRIIIFQWLEDNQLTPTPTTGDILSTSSVFGTYTHDRRKCFRVLDDTVVVLAPGAADGPSATYVRNIALPAQPIQFESAGITGFGQIYSLLIYASAGANAPIMTMFSEFQYENM